MTTQARKRSATRTPLDRSRILEAALALADEEGLEALSMRRLGQRLGVEAMSLYNHVANKEQVLSGMLDLVVGHIALGDTADTWQEAMRDRARSMRRVCTHHPWAVGLLAATKAPGPATLRYCDGILGVLRRGGFSVPMAAAAFYMLDSFIIGYVIQERAAPGEAVAEAEAEAFLEELPADTYPYLSEVASHFVATRFDHHQNFEKGLDSLLNALDAWRDEG